MKHEEAFDLLNEQIKDIPKAQIRTVSLAVLPRLMNALDQQQESCPQCLKHSRQGEDFVNNIRPLFEQNIKMSKSFEQWADEAQKHLKVRHQQHVKGRVTSTYTTIGMAIGTFIAFIYSYFIVENSIAGTISIGWAVGLIFGYISGKLKENTLRKNQQLY